MNLKLNTSDLQLFDSLINLPMLVFLRTSLTERVFLLYCWFIVQDWQREWDGIQEVYELGVLAINKLRWKGWHGFLEVKSTVQNKQLVAFLDPDPNSRQGW